MPDESVTAPPYLSSRGHDGTGGRVPPAASNRPPAGHSRRAVAGFPGKYRIRPAPLRHQACGNLKKEKDSVRSCRPYGRAKALMEA